jgi:N-acetyl-anhydromuramyl-L-alanine amidase AmpD
MNRLAPIVLAAAAALVFAGCTDHKTRSVSARGVPVVQPTVQPGVGLQQRFGDEIVVAGQLYRTGAPVVTWMDPGGYDAYRVDRRFVPYEEADWAATTQAMGAGKVKFESRNQLFAPTRYSLRHGGTTAATQHYSPEELEQVRGGGWPLDLLQKNVDQFVLHYDVCGTSRQCFKILQDYRGLSVHFMLDLDGTIYQTLDLKERAWHATTSNDRSIGIEIANMGSYSVSSSPAPLVEWYQKDKDGKTFIQIPQRYGGADSQRIKDGILRPMRNEAVEGEIHGSKQRMYDLTPQQYDSLIKLTAALCDIFPQIKCDVPRAPDGTVLMTNLEGDALANYKGVMGHFHVQRNKSDPGPAMQWDYLLENARKLLDERKKNPSTAG